MIHSFLCTPWKFPGLHSLNNIHSPGINWACTVGRHCVRYRDTMGRKIKLGPCPLGPQSPVGVRSTAQSSCKYKHGHRPHTGPLPGVSESSMLWHQMTTQTPGFIPSAMGMNTWPCQACRDTVLDSTPLYSVSSSSWGSPLMFWRLPAPEHPPAKSLCSHILIFPSGSKLFHHGSEQAGAHSGGRGPWLPEQPIAPSLRTARSEDREALWQRKRQAFPRQNRQDFSLSHYFFPEAYT